MSCVILCLMSVNCKGLSYLVFVFPGFVVSSVCLSRVCRVQCWPVQSLSFIVFACLEFVVSSVCLSMFCDSTLQLHEYLFVFLVYVNQGQKYVFSIDQQNRYARWQTILPCQPEAKMANETVCKKKPCLQGLLLKQIFQRQKYHKFKRFTRSQRNR